MCLLALLGRVGLMGQSGGLHLVYLIIYWSSISSFVFLNERSKYGHSRRCCCLMPIIGCIFSLLARVSITSSELIGRTC